MKTTIAINPLYVADESKQLVFYAVMRRGYDHVLVTDRDTLIRNYAGNPDVYKGLLQAEDEIETHDQNGNEIIPVRFKLVPNKIILNILKQAKKQENPVEGGTFADLRAELNEVLQTVGQN